MSSMFASRRPYRRSSSSLYSVDNTVRRARMSGSGDAAADMNAIVAPTSVSFPQSASRTMHEILIPHSEFFAGAVRLDQPGAVSPTVATPAPQSFYQIGFFPVTPTLSAGDVSPGLNASYASDPATGNRFCSVAPISYPWQWLQSLASSYDEHCLHELEIQYVPSCIGSTAGQIILGFTPDATSDPSSYTSYQQVVALECSTYGNVYVPQTLRIPIRKYTLPDGWKTVQTATTVGSSALAGVYRGGFQQFMYGFVIICIAGISPLLFSTSSAPSATNTLTTLRSFTFGTLKSKYTWAFRSPVLQPSLLTPLQLKSSYTRLSSAGNSSSYLLPWSTGSLNANMANPGVSIDGFSGWNVSSFVGPLAGSSAAHVNYFIVPVGSYVVSYHVSQTQGPPAGGPAFNMVAVPGSGTRIVSQKNVTDGFSYQGTFTVSCSNVLTAGSFLGLIAMTMPGATATSVWAPSVLLALTVNTYGTDGSFAGL